MPEAERHWAYLPLAPGMLPEVKDQQWVQVRSIAFVLARLEKEGIKPSPRRGPPYHRSSGFITLDLIGLPPSPAEVDAFVSDESSISTPASVTRLLASEHFGRSDGGGTGWTRAATPTPTAMRKTPASQRLLPELGSQKLVNADMPMDRFAVEQIAGDLLPGSDAPPATRHRLSPPNSG